jgi:FHA domain
MASVIWRCPVPACESSSERRGRCGKHQLPLEAVREAPPGEEPAHGQLSADGQHGAAGKEREAQPASLVHRIAIILGGLRTEVPAEGLVVGRALSPWRDVAAVRALTQVSRTTQARLFWQAGTLYVNDAGSSNGTFVDGVRLACPVPLRPGAALRFGLDVDVGVVGLDEFGMVKDTGRDDASPSA